MLTRFKYWFGLHSWEFPTRVQLEKYYSGKSGIKYCTVCKAHLYQLKSGKNVWFNF